jgi:hypothetical protein
MLESATSKQIADRSRPRIDLGDAHGISTCAPRGVHRAIGPVACLLQTGGECVRIDVCDSDTDCCSHHGVRGRANVSCSARASISVMVAVAKSIRSMTDAEVRTATRRACGVGKRQFRCFGLERTMHANRRPGHHRARIGWWRAACYRASRAVGPDRRGCSPHVVVARLRLHVHLRGIGGVARRRCRPSNVAAVRCAIGSCVPDSLCDSSCRGRMRRCGVAGCPTGSRPARVRIARTGGGPDEVRHVVRPTCVVGDLAHSPAGTRRLNIQRLDGFAQIESKWGRTMGQSACATIRQCRQCDRYRLPLSRRASTTG